MKFQIGDIVAYAPSWLKYLKAEATSQLWFVKGTFQGYAKKRSNMQICKVLWNGSSEVSRVNENAICKVGSTEFINTDLKIEEK